MMETGTSVFSKADIDRFFRCKHLYGCPTCGRSQPASVDVRVLGCQQLSRAEDSGSLKVLLTACKNCGAIHFYDCGVIAEWLECHARAQ
jgi:hypothetical protein